MNVIPLSHTPAFSSQSGLSCSATSFPLHPTIWDSCWTNDLDHPNA